MKHNTLAFALTALSVMFAPVGPPAQAADGSLAVCADLDASAGDVAHHCRRALRDGGLNKGQEFGAQVNLGDALVSLGQPSLALDAYNAAIEMRTGRIEPLLGRARALEGMGRLDDAANDWFAAVRLAPNSVDARIGKGAFHMRANAPAAALRDFDEAVRLDPDDVDARFNRGLANLATNRFQAAEADFSRVLQDYPADAGAYFHRARARVGMNAPSAIADFDEAIRYAPEWAEPWFLSGQALERLGRVDDANLRFRRAFELGHKDPWLLNRITSLGG